MFDLKVRFIRNHVTNNFPFASFVVTSNSNQYIASIDYNYFSNDYDIIDCVDNSTIMDIFNITYRDEYASLKKALTAAIRAKVKEKIG